MRFYKLQPRLKDTCAIHAISVACGCSYDKVLFFARRYLLKKGKLSILNVSDGFFSDDIIEMLKMVNENVKISHISDYETPSNKLPTVAQVSNFYKDKVCIILTRDHAIGMVRGNLYDVANPKRKKVREIIIVDSD